MKVNKGPHLEVAHEGGSMQWGLARVVGRLRVSAAIEQQRRHLEGGGGGGGEGEG